jgi:hypothetical protein
LLVWVAGCSFVTVGSATYLARGHGLAVHVLAWIVALAFGVAAAFGISSLATGALPSTLERSHPTPSPVPRDGQQSDAVGRELASVAPSERQAGRPAGDGELANQLALGNRLRVQLQHAISDASPDGTAQLIPEIDNWIGTTRVLLDEQSPQLAQYFATDAHEMAEENWPPKLQDVINLSQSARLNRHLDRLNEIASKSFRP